MMKGVNQEEKGDYMNHNQLCFCSTLLLSLFKLFRSRGIFEYAVQAHAACPTIYQHQVRY